MKNNPARRRNDLTLTKYQKLNVGTDHNPAPSHEDLKLPTLGLVGETGSLASLFKKKLRDKNAFKGLSDAITEELGDLLWYVTNLTDRKGLTLEGIARTAFTQFSSFPPHDGVTFSDIDRVIKGKDSIALGDEIGALSDLATLTTQVLNQFKKGNLEDGWLTTKLAAILKRIANLCAITGISLEEVAQHNRIKTTDRWPLKKTLPQHFDAQSFPEEQLPRQFVVEFKEREINGVQYVYQSINGVHVGDRLTDNTHDPDFYRYHDVFHWSYAAILGWSPITRSLLKRKRKSDPSIDENEDGARAGIIEEAISVWIFHQAKPLDFFKDVSSLDYRILKAVRDLTTGFQSHDIPLWLWEKAILNGYAVFRELTHHRTGRIEGDMKKRSLIFSPIEK